MMRLDEIKLIEIERLLDGKKVVYAHTKDAEKEILVDHMNLCMQCLYQLDAVKDLSKTLDRILKSSEIHLTQDSCNLIKEMFLNAIYMHDIGKINSNFQNQKMKNGEFKKIPLGNAKHSMLSSIIYLDYYIESIKKFKGEEAIILLFFLTIHAYVISKHHSVVEDYYSYLARLSDEIERYLEVPQLYESYTKKLNITGTMFSGLISKLMQYIEKSTINPITIYIYSKFLFSIMTTVDFLATSEFQTQNKIDDFGVIDKIDPYINAFQFSESCQSIHQYAKNPVINNHYENINQLRSEMFLEAEKNLTANLNKHIFYLEAPTGSGKTITSINLALSLVKQCEEIKKIFYIFPFNTLVEQTQESFKSVINNEGLMSNVAVINSITPIKTIDVEEDHTCVVDQESNKKIDYEKSLLNRQFLHYPIVITTHENLFNFLFGISREESFPLLHLANSVVVIDEIQSYKNYIWKELILFLEKYAELLNIKIIIMSATLPKLSVLGVNDTDFTFLIKNRAKYFESPFFKERVSLDFSLLHSENPKENLYCEVISQCEKASKILVEFISKKTALEFYKSISAMDLNKKVMLITGDDNKAERRKIINEVKKREDILLIATQVIEAGVDIDMDIGFKDISILDSEEQFLGRINRSCKKPNSKVYFFNLDSISKIYKQDFRTQQQLTLMEKSIQEILVNKDFNSYYSKVFETINQSKERLNDSNIDSFLCDKVKKLRGKEVYRHMRLIDKNKEVTLFLNTEVKMENGEVLSGHKVWEKFKNILLSKELNYAKRRILLSQVMEKVDFFTYKVPFFDDSYDDVIGDMFYIHNGDKYLVNGKFDRDKLSSHSSCEFIS